MLTASVRYDTSRSAKFCYYLDKIHQTTPPISVRFGIDYYYTIWCFVTCCFVYFIRLVVVSVCVFFFFFLLESVKRAPNCTDSVYVRVCVYA